MICENPDCSTAVHFILDLDDSHSEMEKIEQDNDRHFHEFDIYRCPICKITNLIAKSESTRPNGPMGKWYGRRTYELPVWKVVYNSRLLLRGDQYMLENPNLSCFGYTQLHYKAHVVEYIRPDGSVLSLKRRHNYEIPR